MDLVPLKPQVHQNDEGFESDIDSLSIVSTDDTYTKPSHPETDSANGSASSDSDTEVPPLVQSRDEKYNLVDCLCYTDVKFPNLLVFVIKSEALVFRFGNLEELNRFYVNFSAFKAVANQKAYSNAGTKYNLLQRTDNNGVTHIQITREPEAKVYVAKDEEVVALKTPTQNYKNLKLNQDFQRRDVNSRQRNQSLLLVDQRSNRETKILSTPKPNLSVYRSASIEDLLDEEKSLKKVWNSAEDLLDGPKRPERRRRVKGKAPPPPVLPKPKETPKPLLSNIISQAKSKLTTYQQFKSNSEPRQLQVSTLSRQVKLQPDSSWTNSVPRLLKKPRSKSETRNFTPMAYRYIDTTRNGYQYSGSHTISNRLFGMSAKLKEFSAVQSSNVRRDSLDVIESKWKSIGELTKLRKGDNLKSVIKKDENRRKGNEKKVTFSAYTTVQVV